MLAVTARGDESHGSKVEWNGMKGGEEEEEPY